MIPVPSGVRVWLAGGRTDMRRYALHANMLSLRRLGGIFFVILQYFDLSDVPIALNINLSFHSVLGLDREDTDMQEPGARERHWLRSPLGISDTRRRAAVVDARNRSS
jgi:hypothetical protein